MRAEKRMKDSDPDTDPYPLFLWRCALERRATLSARLGDWPQRHWMDEVLEAVHGNSERRQIVRLTGLDVAQDLQPAFNRGSVLGYPRLDALVCVKLRPQGEVHPGHRFHGESALDFWRQGDGFGAMGVDPLLIHVDPHRHRNSTD
jgi:hypothetical protein